MLGQLALVALATSALATVLSKGEIFKGLQGRGPSWFQYLMRCPWCLSHWISVPLLVLTLPWPGFAQFVVWWGAVTIVATYFSVGLMKLLFVHEQEKNILRGLLKDANEQNSAYKRVLKTQSDTIRKYHADKTPGVAAAAGVHHPQTKEEYMRGLLNDPNKKL
jgi:hypothetical protein